MQMFGSVPSFLAFLLALWCPASTSLRWKISLLTFSPKSNLAQRNHPNGVIIVVSLLDSSSSLTCQKASFTSSLVKIRFSHECFVVWLWVNANSEFAICFSHNSHLAYPLGRSGDRDKYTTFNKVVQFCLDISSECHMYFTTRQSTWFHCWIDLEASYSKIT